MKAHTIILLSALISSAATAQHLEPSAPLGGRGKAAPYNPSTRQQPYRPHPAPVRRQAPVEPPHPNPPATSAPAVQSHEILNQWIAEAIETYPDLAVKDSPLNKAFLEIYYETKATQPFMFNEPHWPLLFATAASDVARQRAESAQPQPSPLIEPVSAIQPAETATTIPPIGVNEPTAVPSRSLASDSVATAPGETPPAPSTDGYTSRISSDDLIKFHNAARDLALQNKIVHVDGYTRGTSQVRPYDRQPPGGLTFTDKVEAEGWGIAAALGAVVIDYGLQKFDAWWKERQRKKQSGTEHLSDPSPVPSAPEISSVVPPLPPGHKFNENGYCVVCGWERDFVRRTNRQCTK